ncbi:MAG: HAMP domain-containing histidine kinase [Clostridia bacterium]|nr:HAMP domain-containing histidine kinase [Clostridia bacterium]
MKLWQKTYLLSTLLCALILYGCMFGVTAPALTATVKGATDAALREEKAIVSALERTMDQAPEGRAIPVLKTFLDYYAGTGLTFGVAKEGEEIFSTLPCLLDKAPGTLGFLRDNGQLHLFISDRLPSGYDFLYLKEAGATDALLKRQVTAAALTGTAVALLMAAALYALLYRINLPVSRLAHEMRTPLTAMKGYAETLRDARLTEEQRHMAASYIADESNRLSDVSARLLTLHNAKEEATPFGPVDVEDLFDHIRQTYPAVTYEVRWPTLFGDQAMLSSLLNNLVDNAVKASPAGAPVELRAAPNILAVTDHGSGLSDAALQYVNHPSKFKKLHDAGGLGVPLCHQIAKAHGAKLTYARGADGGTVATVTFYNSLTS